MPEVINGHEGSNFCCICEDSIKSNSEYLKLVVGPNGDHSSYKFCEKCSRHIEFYKVKRRTKKVKLDIDKKGKVFKRDTFTVKRKPKNSKEWSEVEETGVIESQSSDSIVNIF